MSKQQINLALAILMMATSLLVSCGRPPRLAQQTVAAQSTQSTASNNQAMPAKQSGVETLLQSDEAVDLARFRGWLSNDLAGAAYVPQPRQALLKEMSWSDAAAFLLTTQSRRLNSPGPTDPNDMVYFVVVHGPVTEKIGAGARTVSDSMALVIDQHSQAHYVGIGKPWDTLAPEGAHEMPIPDGPKLTHVSRARAQSEMGEPLVEPVKVPAGLTLQQLTINPVKSAIDPLAATIDNSSVTYVYADASGQPQMWLTEAPSLGEPQSPLTATPVRIGAVTGRRYFHPWQKVPKETVGFAWQGGDHWFFLSADIGPQLDEEAVVQTAASIEVTTPAPAPPPTALPSIPTAQANRIAAAPATNCPVTQPIQERPQDPFFAGMGKAGWYRSADGKLWLEANYGPDWAKKLFWAKPNGALLQVTGHRLDAAAPPMKADVPCCYPGGFQVGGLLFPTAGCWEVETQAEGSVLRFVTYVDSGLDQQAIHCDSLADAVKNSDGILTGHVIDSGPESPGYVWQNVGVGEVLKNPYGDRIDLLQNTSSEVALQTDHLYLIFARYESAQIVCPERTLAEVKDGKVTLLSGKATGKPLWSGDSWEGVKKQIQAVLGADPQMPTPAQGK